MNKHLKSLILVFVMAGQVAGASGSATSLETQTVLERAKATVAQAGKKVVAVVRHPLSVCWLAMGIIVVSELYRNHHKTLAPALNNGVEGTGMAHRGFASISGMDDIKKRLKEEVIDPLQHLKIYARFAVGPANGILLYGPPGCGKTHLAHALKAELNCNFITIKMDKDVGSKWVHETSVKLSNLFGNAETQGPCIVFIDELDSFAPKRDGGMRDDNVTTREEVDTLLRLVDGCSKRGIIFIGATNDKDHIDPALLRSGRMDLHLQIPLPDESARGQLFSSLLLNRPCAPDINVSTLAAQTQGSNSADVKTIVDMAARKAAQDTMAARGANTTDLVPITMESLAQAIRTVVSSRR